MIENGSEGPTPPSKPSLLERIGAGKFIALGICALLVSSLAFAPIRAIASQMLGVFRVQKVRTISITEADLEQLGTVLSEGEGSASLEGLGDVSVVGGNSEPTETTLAAAQAAVDFELEVPRGIDATPQVALQTPMTVKFKLHVDKVNELLESYGATKTLSKSVDGREFELRIPATVVLAYPNKGGERLGNSSDDDIGISDDPATALLVVQTRGPQVVVPEGVNPLEIRDVLIEMPFLPDGIRSQLASVQDWQNTLLIPSVEGSSKEIVVNGAPGVVIGVPEALDETETGGPMPEDMPTVVMWNDNGVTRAVGGVGGEARIVKVAESVGQ